MVVSEPLRAELDPVALLVRFDALQESGIRARSGANVVAVLRADESIASPAPDTRFRVGDTLVVMGQPSQVESFVKTFSSLPSDD